jgi:putative OPT family oligopeptide transporter
MQIVGVVVAALAMAPVLNLLNDAYKIGSDGLPAPQANLMGTVAQGVFEGNLPWTVIGIGAAIAAAVIIIDVILEHRRSSIRVPVMAFAVGVYLPFDLNFSIFLGGVVALLVNRVLDRIRATPERRGVVERMGLLAAAGFITGEALMGIAMAVPVALKHDENALALFVDAKGHPAYSDLRVPSLLFVAAIMFMLFRLALREEPKGGPSVKPR